MSPRGVAGSRSGLDPGLRFDAVEDAAPLKRRPTTGPAASPDGGAPATDGNDHLATALTEEFTDLFREAVTDDFGAVARLHQMLETASEWCRTHGARDSSSELDAIASRLTDLGEECRQGCRAVTAAGARNPDAAQLRAAAETAYALAVRHRDNADWDQSREWVRQCLRLLEGFPSDSEDQVATKRLSVGGVQLPTYLHDGVVRDRFGDIA